MDFDDNSKNRIAPALFLKSKEREREKVQKVIQTQKGPSAGKEELTIKTEQTAKLHR